MPHMRGDEPDRLCPMCNWRRVCPTDVGRYKNEGDDVNMKNLQELPKLKDSISYLYIEHAIIEQNDTAIVAIKKEGKIPIPIAAMTCLLLGPGTRVTHAAIRALCDNGCMAIWCGENATRFYAAGIGETRSAKNLLKQAGACMDQDKHLEVAKRMYQIRFSKMKTDGMTLQQLRGMEGIRVRKAYELAAKTTGIVWKKRSYKSTDWDAADPINQALSEANALLYGLCHAAIVSLATRLGWDLFTRENSFPLCMMWLIFIKRRQRSRWPLKRSEPRSKGEICTRKFG